MRPSCFLLSPSVIGWSPGDYEGPTLHSYKVHGKVNDSSPRGGFLVLFWGPNPKTRGARRRLGRLVFGTLDSLVRIFASEPLAPLLEAAVCDRHPGVANEILV